MLLTQKTTRLDPRVRRTRQLLLRALQELMAEKSFQAITVRDIAERATVNRATFYAHFTDKYALLEFSVREMFRERLQRLLPEARPFSPGNLATLIQTVCDFLAEMSGHCPPPHAQYEPLMEKQIKAEVNEILRNWLAERRLSRSPRAAAPELAAVVASWAIYGAAVQWSQRKRRGPSAEFARQVLPLVLANLGAESVRAAR
ncbi:MAG: TetR/AcrR family transcriptional regulator [Anaerolineales bacterium]